MGGINCIKLLSANKGLLKKAEHNLTTYSGHRELTPQNKISKGPFFVNAKSHKVWKCKIYCVCGLGASNDF